MSMIGVKWFSKDGMSADPGTWCGNDFVTDGEIDNDWVLLETKLPYDANSKTLNALFKRELIGSTSKDFTYKIGEKYDYKLTYGLWSTSGTTDAAIGQTSDLTATSYAPVQVQVASYDDVLATYLKGFTISSALLVAATLY